MTDQSLSAQFLVAGGIVAFFSVISLALLLRQVAGQADASNFLAQTHRTIGRLNTLGRDYYRQQTAVKEFLRTRDSRYLAIAREGRQFWDEGFHAIEDQVRESPPQLQLMERVQESYLAWVKYTDRLMETTKGGKIDSGALRDEGALFKEAFLLIDRMIDIQNKQLTVRDRGEKGAVQSTFTAIAAINIALLVIFGIVLAKLYYSIARPTAALSMGIRKYQGGDFKTRVEVSNRSQIGFLEASFNEMAEKIETMVADLRKLDEMKTEFLSTVSHELRTPLTSIGGYVKLLVSGDAGTVTDTQKEFLYIIDTNVVRLTHLINDILDVEKMEAGKVQLEKEPQDLATILKECRDTFDVLARSKGLELKYDVPSEGLTVIGDRDRLVQVFMNLLSNAIKYTKKGSVSVQVSRSDFAVSVRIRDTGVGLSIVDQEKLFQKFFRARSGISSVEGGTGLGLVIVRGLVEAHGGSIKVESKLAEGTTFTVTLPIAADVLSVVGVEVHEPVQLFSRSVWIVDNHPEDVEAMRVLIEESEPVPRGPKLIARTFSSIEEMPEVHARPDAPVVVVLDPTIAPGGERAMIPELRRKLHQTVPVISVGAATDASVAFAGGASAHLAKPLDAAKFLAAVRDLVSRKGWRILIADSNTDLRILIKRALEQRGFVVDDVDRGNLVMSRLEQEFYDLALVDTQLPDVSGLELLKFIHEVPRFRDLPIFMMSVEDKDIPTTKELASWGASQFVAKYRGLGFIVDTVCQFLEDRKVIEHHH